MSHVFCVFYIRSCLSCLTMNVLSTVFSSFFLYLNLDLSFIIPNCCFCASSNVITIISSSHRKSMHKGKKTVNQTTYIDVV